MQLRRPILLCAVAVVLGPTLDLLSVLLWGTPPPDGWPIVSVAKNLWLLPAISLVWLGLLEVELQSTRRAWLARGLLAALPVVHQTLPMAFRERFSWWVNAVFVLVLPSAILFSSAAEGTILLLRRFSSDPTRRLVWGLGTMLVTAIAGVGTYMMAIPTGRVSPAGVMRLGMLMVSCLLVGLGTVLWRMREELAMVLRLRDYRLLRSLGKGGMGEVFLARRVGPEGFQRRVAIKRVLRQRPEDVALFLEEARIAARLSHPNIGAVYDLGRLGDGWFMAMEYVEGASLWQVVCAAARAGRPVPLGTLVTVAEALARGLGSAHAAGVLHRDVSPQNVMIGFDGAIKLVDFGIARRSAAPPPPTAGLPSDALWTGTGLVAGKAGYIAPELLAGSAPSQKSDLWSLGATLYELAAGPRPSTDPPPPIRLARPDLPPEMLAVFDRLLATDPARRFPDTTALLAALAAIPLPGPRPEIGAWTRELIGVPAVDPVAPTELVPARRADPGATTELRRR